jgi:predicted nucleotidyltransferase
VGLTELNKEQINQLCKNYNVRNLYVFGSVLTSNFNLNSDIDFAVDFNKMDIALYADNYFNLKISLQTILKREIDLLELQAIKNPYFRQSLDSTKIMVYGS